MKKAALWSMLLALGPLNKAFDDLYWMGTPSRSTWALTRTDGIILYDTHCFKIEDECAQAVRLKLLAQQHEAAK
jgi:hypothetical protein